jgi:hypothetical protein
MQTQFNTKAQTASEKRENIRSKGKENLFHHSPPGNIEAKEGQWQAAKLIDSSREL